MEECKWGGSLLHAEWSEFGDAERVERRLCFVFLGRCLAEGMPDGPLELQTYMQTHPDFAQAFEALTPGPKSWPGRECRSDRGGVLVYL